MKHLFLSIALILACLPGLAQNTVERPQPNETVQAATHFGYLSYNAALEAMPGYADAIRSLDALQAKYDQEMKRVEDEFNTKYEQFLEGQSSFAPSILQKRQAELQEMMDKNMAFKQEARHLMDEARQNAMAPLRDKLNAAIRLVGTKKNLAFVLNTDNNSVPFVNPAAGEDISANVAALLKP